MINPKIPLATTIPLLPLEGEEFYAIIIPEEMNKKTWDTLWVFRKGCGVALCCTSKRANHDDTTMTIDGVKALDAIGYYDDVKEMLIESE